MKQEQVSFNRKKRVVLDSLMMLFFLILEATGTMAARPVRLLHEWVGTALFVTLILHTVWNRRWYTALFRGRYSPKRILYTVTDLALAVFIVLLVISGPLVSHYVFAFLQINALSVGRSLHLLATAWAFLLSGFHLGLHHGGARRSPVMVLLSVGGVVSFLHLELWKRLFLVTAFAYAPSVSVWIQGLEFLLILCLAGFLGAEAVRAAERGTGK